MIIALAGNPNSGKTTLFNALTGANQYVGNWPGVTVEKKEARLSLNGEEGLLIDLPGAYSLESYSIEERITRDYIAKERPDVVLNIVDATNLERNLYLTLQLMELRRPMVVALNMMDELSASGGQVDAQGLSFALGVPVIPISARKKQGLDPLFAAIYREKIRGIHAKYPPLKLSGSRYDAIERLLLAARYQMPAGDVTDKIDRIVTHKLWAFPIFLSVMGLMFAVTFGPIGKLLSRLMEWLINDVVGGGATYLLLKGGPPQWLSSLVMDGIIAGVGGVVTFLPQILLIFLFLSILEDSGYMARAAFITDRLFQSLGLSGRAFIPMLMGFGCTTTAVMAARSVASEREKRMIIMLTPYMSCGAKLPVYGLIAAAVFPTHAAVAVFSLYVLGMAVMILLGLLLRNTSFGAGDSDFVMELPPYRMPTFANVSRRLFTRAKDFLIRAGTMIFLMSILILALKSFTPHLRYTHFSDESIFGHFGRAIAPAFAPLGFSDWRKVVAMLSGLVAKEAIVSTMQVLYNTADVSMLTSNLANQFAGLSAYAYLVFILLYPPCISAMASISREMNSTRHTIMTICLQIAVAYIAALMVYNLGGGLLQAFGNLNAL